MMASNRWRYAMRILAVFCMVAGVATVAEAQNETRQRDSRAEAEKLVLRLGESQFASRERATQQLIKIGLPAIEALRKGSQNDDREIRYRSERILVVVRQLDLQRRLEAFATDLDDKENYDLPGWSRFEELIGDNAQSRALFVQMQLAEAELLKSIEKGPLAAAEMLTLRSRQLQEAMRLFKYQVSLGNVAALLFVAGDERVGINPQAHSTLYSFCYQSSFASAVTGGPQRNAARKLLGAWIRRSQDASAYQAMALAMRYDLKEGLVPAEKALRNGANPTHVRQYAILTVAKLGGASYLTLLVPLLEDKTRCAAQRVNNTTYETQLRDVAMAAILHIDGHDVTRFGFERAQRNSQIVFNTSTLGFESDEHRRQAMRLWNEYRSAQKNDTD